MADAADLVAMIEDQPEDPDAYRTYCDWLEERGDPRRSQLLGYHQIRDKLTAGLAIDRTKLDHLDARLTAFFEEHRAYFWGPLASVMPPPTASQQRRRNAQEIEWRNAFIYKVRLRPITRPRIDKLVEMLLTSESGRFVVDFDLGWFDGPATPVLEAFAAHVPRSLRRLQIHDRDEGFAYDTLWPKLARLEALVVSGTKLATMALPALRRLEVRSCDPHDLVRGLVHGGLPALTHLVLYNDDVVPMLAPLAIVDQLEALEIRRPETVAGTRLARVARGFDRD